MIAFSRLSVRHLRLPRFNLTVLCTNLPSLCLVNGYISNLPRGILIRSVRHHVAFLVDINIDVEVFLDSVFIIVVVIIVGAAGLMLTPFVTKLVDTSPPNRQVRL